MKRKAWRKFGYLFATTLVLGTSAVGTVNALAADGGTGTTTQAPAAIADNTSQRSITVHKYKIDSADELKNVTDRDTGELNPDKVKNLAPLKGVEFTIQKVTPKNGASLTDPTKQKEGTDYELVDGTAKKVSTGDDGTATFDLGKGAANDGLYIVTETGKTYEDATGTHAITKPADPFFVYVPQTKRGTTDSLLYDVNVYPKNIMSTKLNPKKTVEGQAGFSNKAGVPFNWYGTIDVPDGLYYQVKKGETYYDVNDQKQVAANDMDVYATEFGIDDQLSDQLQFNSLKVQYTTDGKTWTDLKAGAQGETKENSTGDYLITQNGQKVSVDFTNTGLKNLVDQKAKNVRVVYNTTAKDDNFSGVIQNTITPRYHTPGLPPTPPENIPSIPEYPTGGFDILKNAEDKKDKDGNLEKLSGAEFKIATSEDNAKAGTFVQNKAGKDLSATSGADGVASFDGLELNIPDNMKGDNAPKDTTRTFTKDYWIVETKAPSGYELLKTPQKVTISTTATYDDQGKITAVKGTFTKDATEATVTDKPKTDLPFTGGQGLLLIIIIASALGVAGVTGIYISNKKKEA
ncbi:SpaH/EbpB family LPXTG-anchored major pilin [Enterococcus sp. CSURQ0835]|uniref:SpaH/EbpB family LPXTG-anchored major pilin n=1 Tax=Enterococcus sp. CSURQ0835 TaxID=2681394 RepID=UPI0013587E21|nr:SpaH/EbpB family LPXTG-anchored major pilin [Enterococcus sp. CSURQ0835]